MKTTHTLRTAPVPQPRRRRTLLLGVVALSVLPAFQHSADGAPPPVGLRPVNNKSDMAHSEQGNFGLGGGGSGSGLNPAFGIGGGGSTSLSGPECPADWDGDGAISSIDVSYYFNDYFTDLNHGTLLADFNIDNITNSSDAVQFINAWFLGCW